MFKFPNRKAPENITPKLSRGEIRELKWNRMMRRKLRWAVIRRYKILDGFQYAKTLFEVKDLIKDWNLTQDIINEIKDVHLSDADIEIIVRFIRREQLFNRCDYECSLMISLDDYYSKENLNIQECLISAYDNYEAYWDDVLSNYKRPSSKKKRLHDLIDSLDKDSQDPMTNFSEVQKRLSEMRFKYSNLLHHLSS